MGKAQAANSRIAIALESVPGTNPATGAEFFRFTSDGLRHDITTAESQEVRSNRNPPGAIRTNQLGRGPLGFEFVPSHWVGTKTLVDKLFAGALNSAWIGAGDGVDDNELTASVAVTGANAGAKTATFDIGSGTAFQYLEVGQCIRSAGFAQSANNGICRVTAVTDDNTILVEGLPFVNEPAATVTIEGRTLTIGESFSSFAIEKQLRDNAGTGVAYFLYLYSLINLWSLQFRSREIVTGSLEFMSMFPDSFDASQIGTVAAADALRAANTITNILRIRIDDLKTDTTLKGTEISFELNNNVTDLPALGVLGPDELVVGSCSLQGRMNLYMSDRTMAQKIENESQFAISWATRWVTRTGATRADEMVITFPLCDLGEFEAVIPGRTGAIGQNMTYFPREDANGKAMRVDMFYSDV